VYPYLACVSPYLFCFILPQPDESESEEEDDELQEDNDMPDDAWVIGVAQSMERASERTDTVSLASTIRSVAASKAKKRSTANEPKRPKPPATLKEDDFHIVTQEYSNREINSVAVEMVDKAVRENMEKMLPKMSATDRDHYTRKFNLKPPVDLSTESSSLAPRLAQSGPVAILPPPPKVRKPLDHRQRLINLRHLRTRPFRKRDVYIWRENGSIEAQNPDCPPPPVSSLVLGEYGADAVPAVSTSAVSRSRERAATGTSASTSGTFAPRDRSVTDSDTGLRVNSSQPFRRVSAPAVEPVVDQTSEPPVPVSLLPRSNTAPTSPHVPLPARSSTPPTSFVPAQIWSATETVSVDMEPSTDPFTLPETSLFAPTEPSGTTDPFQDASSASDLNEHFEPFNFPVSTTSSALDSSADNEYVDPFRLPASTTDPFHVPTPR